MAYFIKKKNMGSVDEIYMARRDNTGSDMDAYNYIMLDIPKETYSKFTDVDYTLLSFDTEAEANAFLSGGSITDMEVVEE